MKRFSFIIMCLLLAGLTYSEVLLASKKRRRRQKRSQQKLKAKKQEQEQMEESGFKTAFSDTSVNNCINLAKKYMKACDQKKIEHCKAKLCEELFTQTSDENDKRIYQVVRWAVKNGKTALIEMFLPLPQGAKVIGEKIEEITTLASQNERKDIIDLLREYDLLSDEEEKTFVQQQVCGAPESLRGNIQDPDLSSFSSADLEKYLVQALITGKFAEADAIETVIAVRKK